ncbi:BURP domain-containing protein, partial [Prunus dulcis]
EMGSNVELVWPEAEAYSSRVNNCSHANSSLAALRAKLSAEQLEQFKTSCFGHLLNIDKIQFSGQIVHGAVLRRVAGQGVKDLDGLSFLLGCDVAQFTRQDFCLITGLRFGEVPEVSSGESDGIRLRERYFIDEGITCNALEEAFLRCTEEDDIYKLALVYFAELVVLGRDKHLNINLNYLTLVEDLDAFNRYPWGSVSFDKTQDSLFSAPTKYVKSFENEDGRGKGKSKATGTSRRNEKGKKDKHGEAQRSGWSFKGFTYAFQIWVYELIPRMADLNYCKVVDPTAVPRILRWRTTTSVPEMRKLNNYFFQSKESVQLRALCPSEEEMRQPYWSWPQDRPAVVSAEPIPSSCGDIDELNKVVSLLRSELFQVKREKDVLHLKVIRMEKLLDQCLGPQFEQEGYPQMDDLLQQDEGPSNRNEGEEKEDEGIEGGVGPSNRNEGEEKGEEGIEGAEGPSNTTEGEEKEEEGIEGGEVQGKPSEVEEGQRKTSEGEQVQGGQEVKRQRSEEKEVQRNPCEKEDNEVMLLGGDIGESTEGTQLEFSIRDIDLDQHTAVLSKLNVWLNHNGKASAQGVQLRKRKRIIPKWKIIEASELVPKTAAQTTGLKTLDPMKAIPHDDLVNLLKLCWEWRQDPNLVMQFGNVEAEIEFLASLVKADGWLKGDRQQQLEEVEIADWTTTDVFFMNHISTCFAENKRKKQQVGWKIRKSLLNVVNGKVPPCGLDWQNVYTVYTPFMLTKYKHWVAVMIDLVLCEIKVYDSKVSLIPDDIIKEELAPLSITLPNLLNTMDFYEEGVYANNCSRDWWCPWPIERVDVPQQSNEGDCGMFVLKYIELLSAQLPLATCTSHNMPFFRLKLAAEITRGDAYFP